MTNAGTNNYILHIRWDVIVLFHNYFSPWQWALSSTVCDSARCGHVGWGKQSIMWRPYRAKMHTYLQQNIVGCSYLHNFNIVAYCLFRLLSFHITSFAGEKHSQKIIIPIYRLVLQNFAIPGYFPYILFYCYLFSLLSSVWFVIAVVCGSISVRELELS